MTIKKKLRISAVLSIGFVIVMGVSLIVEMKEANQASQEDIQASELVRGVAELNIVTYMYLLHHEAWARTQWLTKHESLTEQLRSLNFQGGAEKTLSAELHHSLDRIESIFTQLTSNHVKSKSMQNEEAFLSQELEDRLAGQLLLRSQEMVSFSFQLHALTHASIEHFHQVISVWTVGLILLLGVSVSTISILISRGLSTAIEKLLEGIEIIGSGNLDARVGTEIQDEIGQVSRAFDRMAENLRSVLTSRANLEREVSERKQAEKALRESKELFEKTFISQRDAIFILNSEFPARILDCNPSSETTFGYARDEMVGSTTALLHVSKRSLSQFQEDLYPAVESSGYYHHPEFEMKRRDGTVFPTDISVAPLGDEEGKRIGWVSVVRDITKVKRMEQEALRTKKIEATGILAAGIAHDFNNILTVILGYIDLSRMGSESGTDLYDYLSETEKACRQAKDLAKRFITFSGGSEPVKQMGSLSALIDNLLKADFSDPRVKCSFSEADDLWPVGFDEGQVKQVFSHLLANAKEAMPEGGALTISISNDRIQEEMGGHGLPLVGAKYVTVSIEDHGVGIPKEDLPRIFDPYFSTKEMGAQKGMGLGLTICHSIIKNHGGHITVESEAGVGTTFLVYLPAM